MNKHLLILGKYQRLIFTRQTFPLMNEHFMLMWMNIKGVIRVIIIVRMYLYFQKNKTIHAPD